jgi:negative regulator of sigma E activity
VPEHQQRETPEHEQYEELCALAAGGLLEGAELVDFNAHMKECCECRSDYEALSNLVSRDLPQAQGTLRQKLAEMRAKPLPYSRQRFLRRAQAEGVVFSREVETPESRPWYFRFVTVLAPVAALVVVAVILGVYHLRETGDTARSNDAAAQQIAELKRENSALAASRSQLSESLAKEQREMQSLRRQLGNVSPTAETLRQKGEQSSSQNAQLLEETRKQEKLLAEAKG